MWKVASSLCCGDFENGVCKTEQFLHVRVTVSEDAQSLCRCRSGAHFPNPTVCLVPWWGHRDGGTANPPMSMKLPIYRLHVPGLEGPALSPWCSVTCREPRGRGTRWRNVWMDTEQAGFSSRTLDSGYQLSLTSPVLPQMSHFPFETQFSHLSNGRGSNSNKKRERSRSLGSCRDRRTKASLALFQPIVSRSQKSNPGMSCVDTFLRTCENLLVFKCWQILVKHCVGQKVVYG